MMLKAAAVWLLLQQSSLMADAFSPTRMYGEIGSRQRSILLMGYLDDLSPPSEDEGLPKKKIVPTAGTNQPGGTVPTGRGGEKSYLDRMAGGGRTDQTDNTIPTPKKEKKFPAWSSGYLTEFLDGNDDSRTDVRNLLTQRAIQSFIYLLENCRDPHSAKWIREDLLQTGNLIDFHGTGAGFIERFGGTWDAPLLAMTQRPKETMIISAKRRGRGHGGWSKNNPYLKERWVEFPIQIDPPNLASRILSVRQQIADEWINDLDVLLGANDQILESYFTKIRQGGVDSDDMAFDRMTVSLMNDETKPHTGSSPFRIANFDLLHNLCTQAAIHRLLRTCKEAGREYRNALFVFLSDFYKEHAKEHFDGDLPYGQADSFIDMLLKTPPVLLTLEDNTTTLTDPIGTAESIIRTRDVVAKEWKEIMRRVKEDHSVVQRSVLTKQWDSPTDPNEKGDDNAGFQ